MLETGLTTIDTVDWELISNFKYLIISRNHLTNIDKAITGNIGPLVVYADDNNIQTLPTADNIGLVYWLSLSNNTTVL